MKAPRSWTRRRRRAVGLCAAGVLVAGMLTVATTSSALTASSAFGNLSEALQKSLYFYDAEKSGPSRSTGHQPLEWRGDSEPTDAKVPLTAGASADGLAMTGTNLPSSFITQYKSILDPDGDGTLDLSGGFHDAGDHVKFGLPQSYAAATLGWGVYEFKDAYVATGTYEHAMEELRWFTDYLLRSTFRDSTGKVIAFNYMVGRGSVDHTYWGPPELQDGTKYPRSATFDYVGAPTPAPDQDAGAAAALAIMYLNTRDSDSAYATKCLDAAKALYTFAKSGWDPAKNNAGNGDGFYNSSFSEDELTWAATWLYIATGTSSYITDITATDASGSFTGYLRKIIHSPGDNWQNIWVHSWDTVWGGAFAKLATVTKGVVSDELNAKFQYYFKWNIEYWTGGQVKHDEANDTAFIATSPAGYSVVATWGSARYNTAAQLCALVYRKSYPSDAKSTQFSDWALGQMNYLMGSNPLKRSMIVGFAPSGTTSVQHPHHRAAHGSMTNSMLVPENHKHTLWGALAGGPDTSDEHKDLTTDYVYNEVAVDYNAGFVGALAGLYQYYGAGQANAKWTPPAEPTETPFFTTAKLEQENNQRTQVTLTVNSVGTHPPATVKGLSVRYFFNISELTSHGQDISAVHTATYYDESKTSYGAGATLSEPQAYNAASGIYYIEVSWPNDPIAGKRDFQFGLIVDQDSTWQSWWDGSNDWSHTGLSSTAAAQNANIPVYLNGTKQWGNEPGQTSSPTPPVTTTRPPTTAPTTARTTAPTTARTTAPTTARTTAPTTARTTAPTTARTTAPTTARTTAPTTTRPPTTGPTSVGTCTATVTLVNSWPSGYQATVAVRNNGTSALSPWTVTWTMPSGATISAGWNATVTQSGTTVTAAAPTWAPTLAAGATATIGFTANGPSSPLPTAITLNGALCS